MMTTTFRQLRDKKACSDRYAHLVNALGGIEVYGDETPITLLQILDSNGVEDALWAIRACNMTTKEQKEVQLLACDYAERVLHIYENQYPGDNRPRNAIETKRRWINGDATAKELKGVAAAANAAYVAAANAAAAADTAVAYAANADAAYAAANAANAAAAAADAAATANAAYAYAYAVAADAADAANAAYAYAVAANAAYAAAAYAAANAAYAVDAVGAANAAYAYAVDAVDAAAYKKEHSWQEGKLRGLLTSL